MESGLTHGIMRHTAWRAGVLLAFLALLLAPPSTSAQDAGSRDPAATALTGGERRRR